MKLSSIKLLSQKEICIVIPVAGFAIYITSYPLIWKLDAVEPTPFEIALQYAWFVFPMISFIGLSVALREIKLNGFGIITTLAFFANIIWLVLFFLMVYAFLIVGITA